jgi:hypothetical protein
MVLSKPLRGCLTWVRKADRCEAILLRRSLPKLQGPLTMDTIGEKAFNACYIPVYAIPKRQVTSERKFWQGF